MTEAKTEAMMAFPQHRHPFESTPIHAEGASTVLYQGKRITLTQTGPGEGLLVQPQDLAAINGFELKPEGACLGELCIPLNDQIVQTHDGRTWVDLPAFADHMGQPFVADTNARVWSFAEVPAKRDNTMMHAMAPDIALTDRAGNVIELADLKGKKALIVTWSSW